MYIIELVELGVWWNMSAYLSLPTGLKYKGIKMKKKKVNTYRNYSICWQYIHVSSAVACFVFDQFDIVTI